MHGGELKDHGLSTRNDIPKKFSHRLLRGRARPARGEALDLEFCIEKGRWPMETAAAGMAVLDVVGFLVGFLLIVEFFLIGHRVYKIRQEPQKQSAQLEQQNERLAAISANLVGLINLTRQSPLSPPERPRAAWTQRGWPKSAIRASTDAFRSSSSGGKIVTCVPVP